MSFNHIRKAAVAIVLLSLLVAAARAEAQISIIAGKPGSSTTAPATPPAAPPAGGGDIAPLPSQNMVYAIGPNLGDPRMHSCHTTEDCAVVNPGCGLRHIAINSAFAADVQIFYDNNARIQGNCRLVTDNQNDVAVCNPAHQCSLALPGSNGMPQPNAPTFCNTAQDCTVYSDACGRKVALNQQSAAVAPPPGDASACSYTDTSTVQSLDCVNHACRLELQNH